MNDATERLLERLQTGWRPIAEQIDRDVRQRKLALWDFVPGRSTQPTMQIWGYLVEQPAEPNMNWSTKVVLWIDPCFAWALCEDGLYWLLSDVVVRRHAVAYGTACFADTDVRPIEITADMLAGLTIDEILRRHPTVTRDALHVAIVQAFRRLESEAARVGEWPRDPLEAALAILEKAPDVPAEPGDEMPDGED